MFLKRDVDFIPDGILEKLANLPNSGNGLPNVAQYWTDGSYYILSTLADRYMPCDFAFSLAEPYGVNFIHFPQSDHSGVWDFGSCDPGGMLSKRGGYPLVYSPINESPYEGSIDCID